MKYFIPSFIIVSLSLILAIVFTSIGIRDSNIRKNKCEEAKQEFIKTHTDESILKMIDKC